MAERVASLYAEIGAKTEGFQAGAQTVKKGLEELSRRALLTSGAFNTDFRNALTSGVANMKTFGASLLEQADKAGVSTVEMQRMAGATGMWTDTQTRAARASANVAAKAAELSKAVADGSMSATEAGAAFRQYAASQEVTSTSVVSLSKAVAVATASLVAIGMALKQVYDIGKQGAALEYTEAKFGRLANSIGVTSDVLLNEMMVATKGTLSEFDAMRTAADLLGLGLARNRSEAVRLATVQAGLGMDTGQLVLALANQSIKRFDQLGLSLMGFQEKLDELKKSGMDADSAFREAFLQQAEEQLARVGNAADSTAGDFMRFEAAMKDLGDEVKTTTSGAIVPFIEQATQAARGWGEFLKFAGSQSEIREIQIGLQKAAGGTKDLVYYAEEARVVWAAQQQQLGGNVDALDATARAHWGLRDATKDAAGYLEDETKAAEANTAAHKQMLDSMADFQGIADTYNDKMEDLTAEYDELVKRKGELTGRNKKERDEIEDLNEKIDENIAKQKEAAAAAEEASKRQVVAMLQTRLASDVEGLTDADVNALLTLQQQWGLMSDEAVRAGQTVNAAVTQYLLTGDLAAFQAQVSGATTMFGTLTSAASKKAGEVGAALGTIDTAPAETRFEQIEGKINTMGPTATSASETINTAMQNVDTAPALRMLNTVETKLYELVQDTWIIRVNVVPSFMGDLSRAIASGHMPFPGAGGYNPTPPEEQATGGPVWARQAYLVGERGPELFVPAANGAIIPNTQLAQARALPSFANSANSAVGLLDELPIEKTIMVNVQFNANGQRIEPTTLYDLLNALQ